ncbi:MAG: hypothetical protein DRJ97_00635 [Thermoprotei archaeon]|nr:MAG: hypothetical protein DRJ97_00635 [Thermoprotei archaeon]
MPLPRLEVVRMREGLRVKAPLSLVKEVAREVLGWDVEEKREGQRIVLTARSLLCPPQVIIEEVDKDTYLVSTASRCDLKDCTYFTRCARLEAERLRLLAALFNDRLEKAASSKQLSRWSPERVDEAAAMTVVERVIALFKT